MNDKAYIVTVDMGYGHQRAVFPLEKIATLPENWRATQQNIISANAYPDIPTIDKLLWLGTRKIYETLSRMHGFPILGKRLFHILNIVETIPSFYPRRDLHRPNGAILFAYFFIRLGFGKHLIGELNKNPRPLIVSFPLCAFMAEVHQYVGEIYCLCTDTDIARAWVPVNPAKSRIKYLAPTFRVHERLKSYGVPPENIFLTGFPVPEISSEKKTAYDETGTILAKRLSRLDPHHSYAKRYRGLLSLYIGQDHSTPSSHSRVTIAFAVGGAGAQTEIGLHLLHSLEKQIRDGSIRLILVAGSSKRIKKIFEREVHRLQLGKLLDKDLKILFDRDKYRYFQKFNELLAETDILWTKPSELSFYVGLGVPIIMTPPLGAQEDCNRDWLLMMGAGISQYDPRYAHEWLPDWINSGRLAHAAASGFVNASRDAADRIESIVLHGVKKEIEEVGFI
ncbi:MAG: hypothetical protein KGJ35_02425 [Patescibacteria group bacterium]|nr:hypothetical protein [Patescibacteria group bacterium]